jgi:hypothetical protein
LNTRALKTFPQPRLQLAVFLTCLVTGGAGMWNSNLEHDANVMQMNAVLHGASGAVQSRGHNFASMIDGTDHSHGSSRSLTLEKEMTMLKTISAALLAASVVAAPVFAATADKTTQAPTTSTASTRTTTTKAGVSNAKAKVTKHHSRHQSHKNMGAAKAKSKLSSKPAASSTKRG